MNGESAGPGLLAKKFASMTPKSDHMNAVQAQVRLTLELFVGLLNEGKTENGVAAEALLRSVFDSVINAVILAKHPEKLDDFIRHGKFSQMRQMRFTTELTPEMQKHVQSIITKTEPDWGALFKEFKNTDWHKLGTRASFVEAEFNEGYTTNTSALHQRTAMQNPTCSSIPPTTIGTLGESVDARNIGSCTGFRPTTWAATQ